MNWILDRLKESSTWRGIVWLLTVAGIALEPEQKEAIITAGIAIAGLLGVFTRDSSTTDSQTQRTERQPIELQSRIETSRSHHVADDLGVGGNVVSDLDYRSRIAPDRVQSHVPTPSERVAKLAEHDFTSGFNDQ